MQKVAIVAMYYFVSYITAYTVNTSNACRAK